MADFVDHLQFLPVPSLNGTRQPDGVHRPGGLGTLTLAERLNSGGWTARLEDFAYEKPMPESRLVEAYARGVSDGVLSAWDRHRFPILLSRVNYGSLGVSDAFSPSLGIVWVGPRLDYQVRRWFHRSPLDRSALALVTGRAKRDRLALGRAPSPPGQIVVVGGGASSDGEREALKHDGSQIVGLEKLSEAVAGVGVDDWLIHLDTSALSADSVPASDEATESGFDPSAVARAVGESMAGKSIRCVAITRYDLNRDREGRSVDTLVEFLERVLRTAGGEPRPTTPERMQEA